MAKRFTDSRKWDDDWFLSLDPAWKLAWFYMLDKCNHAGIYKHAIPLEECCLGFTLNPDTIKEQFGNRVILLTETKWFIPKYIDFQYGELNPVNKAHISVISILKDEGVYKGDLSPFQGAKDKDKDMNKDKEKDKGGVGGKFEQFWSLYPKPVGQSMALLTFNATIKTDKDFEDLMTALKNYMESEEYKKGFIKNGDNWIEDWRGWLRKPKKTIKRQPDPIPTRPKDVFQGGAKEDIERIFKT